MVVYGIWGEEGKCFFMVFFSKSVNNEQSPSLFISESWIHWVTMNELSNAKDLLFIDNFWICVNSNFKNKFGTVEVSLIKEECKLLPFWNTGYILPCFFSHWEIWHIFPLGKRQRPLKFARLLTTRNVKEYLRIPEWDLVLISVIFSDFQSYEMSMHNIWYNVDNRHVTPVFAVVQVFWNCFPRKSISEIHV